MTLQEEFLGWKVSMKSFDRSLWLAALGDEADLAPHVALPKDFIKRRSQLAVVMSDQVPIWIKIGKPKIVFSEFELGPQTRDQTQLVSVDALAEFDDVGD